MCPGAALLPLRTASLEYCMVFLGIHTKEAELPARGRATVRGGSATVAQMSHVLHTAGTLLLRGMSACTKLVSALVCCSSGPRRCQFAPIGDTVGAWAHQAVCPLAAVWGPHVVLHDGGRPRVSLRRPQRVVQGCGLDSLRP